jgi:hypothetical protein
MSQLQLRDPNGQPIPRLNVRIALGTGDSDAAIFDVMTDESGNQTWPIPFWPARDYTLHVNYRQVNPAWAPQSVHVPAHGTEPEDVLIVMVPTVAVPIVEPVPRDRRPRRGLVRTDGARWRDDDGYFYPLGDTLFWVLDGWRHDRDRLLRQVEYIASFGHDAVRVLGDTAWDGQAIDSSAADYEQVFGEAIDALYERGLRTQITVWGGPSPRDPIAAARRVVRIAAGRQEKISLLEAANESSQDGPDDATVDQMIGILRTTGLPVAGSTAMGDNSAGQWFAYDDARVRAGATVTTVHYDRAVGDDDWRFVRQPWDSRHSRVPVVNNEGKGPRSSIAETTDVARLAMFRLVGLFCRAGYFNLHNAVGVTGRLDPSRNRPENLWQVPGIDAIMIALRRMDAWLPDDLATWQTTTQHGGFRDPTFENIGNVLQAGAIWPEEGTAGVSRMYGAIAGRRFIQALIGARGTVQLRASRACRFSLIDLVTGEARPVDTEAREGEIVTATGADSALVAIGEVL